MVGRLYQLDLIKEKSVQDVVESIACNRNNYKCMTRKCNKCFNKTTEFTTFENSEENTYSQWIKVTEKRMIKGKERDVNYIVKGPVECTKKELIEKFVDMLPKFLKHVLTI